MSDSIEFMLFATSMIFTNPEDPEDVIEHITVGKAAYDRVIRMEAKNGKVLTSSFTTPVEFA